MCKYANGNRSSQLMVPSTQHRGVQRISGDRVDSTIGLRADTPGGSNGSALNLAPPNRSLLSLFTILTFVG
ncbi:hypothetical protein SK128_007045 [Halocaridina rubra]|uniref:Uncharacterized protein n=1 Tax=Halocaridina rubra TaxID=373956 RepID=A0AAN8WVH9_HALRR